VILCIALGLEFTMYLFGHLDSSTFVTVVILVPSAKKVGLVTGGYFNRAYHMLAPLGASID
jgi:hypothetical protein